MKRIKGYRLFLIFLFVFVALSFRISAASITDSLMNRGNSYYLNRQYENAEACYIRIIRLGLESGELYYNLGNACYKQEKFANAILYYEKALLLKPGDEDIKQNLALANVHIIDKIDVIPDFFLKRWIRLIQGLFSPDQWAVLGFVLFLLAMVSFTFFYFLRSIRFRKAGFSIGSVFLILFLFSLLFMFGRIQRIRQHNSAIIMAPSVNARSSPDEQSTNVFVLHQGTKVMITDSVQHWKEIRIANGNKGWVEKGLLSEI